MIDIADSSLYHRCTIKAHNATVRMVRPGAKVYDRSRQRITTTTEQRRLVVVGPVGERVVYGEQEFQQYYDLLLDEKTMKKLHRGKIFKIKSKEGAEAGYFLRIPPEEPFLLYDEIGAPVEGNTQNFMLNHAEGDCILCPAAPGGGPDLTKPHLVNGEVFSARYQ